MTKIEAMADQERFAGQFKGIVSDLPFGCMKNGDGRIRDDDQITNHEITRVCSSWKKLLKHDGECNDVRYARARASKCPCECACRWVGVRGCGCGVYVNTVLRN